MSDPTADCFHRFLLAPIAPPLVYGLIAPIYILAQNPGEEKVAIFASEMFWALPWNFTTGVIIWGVRRCGVTSKEKVLDALVAAVASIVIQSAVAYMNME